jgi:putative transcriptional regulator
MPHPESSSLSLAGVLLLSNPQHAGHPFPNTVAMVAFHSADQGALGIILNRPLPETLGPYDPDFMDTPLAHIPLLEGGPVGPDEMILTGWEWAPEKSLFRLYFGLNFQAACQLIEQNPKVQIRGFLGHLGWRYTQLNQEVVSGVWIVAPMDEKAILAEERHRLWQHYMGLQRPEFLLFKNLPADPSLN